jgi:hypothetical protein
MTRPSVVLVAPFDDAQHAHNAQRGRALERLGCDVTAVNLMERRGPLGLFRNKDIRTRLEEAIRTAAPDLVLAIGARNSTPRPWSRCRASRRRSG